jgi:hypothetical protein
VPGASSDSHRFKKGNHSSTDNFHFNVHYIANPLGKASGSWFRLYSISNTQNALAAVSLSLPLSTPAGIRLTACLVAAEEAKLHLQAKKGGIFALLLWFGGVLQCLGVFRLKLTRRLWPATNLPSYLTLLK